VITDDHEKSEISHGYRTTVAQTRCVMSGRSRRRGFGYVRKLPSGRWQASYLGPDLVRRTAPHTFDAKADAEGWLGRRREEVVSGEWQPPVKVERVAALTFDAYATQWLRERALKPRTREGYEHLLGRYLLPVLGRMPSDAITPSVVRTWWSRLPADKPTVRARSYALLKAVMNTAVADEVIDGNPCRIRGAANTPRAREIRPATIEELEVIVEAMPDRLRALVLLCAWCALRSGEVLELRRRDVDIAGGTVRIVRALSWVGGEPIVGTPKSAAGTRVVSIPPHVVPAIAHHLDTMAAPGPDALVFPGRDGVSHLQPSTMHRHWRNAREAAGRPDLRVHDLRHTGATMAARAGATLAELQERLGHSSVNAALRYQHAARGRDQEIAAALSAMARSSST
jgi:integrase